MLQANQERKTFNNKHFRSYFYSLIFFGILIQTNRKNKCVTSLFPFLYYKFTVYWHLSWRPSTAYSPTPLWLLHLWRSTQHWLAVATDQATCRLQIVPVMPPTLSAQSGGRPCAILPDWYADCSHRWPITIDSYRDASNGDYVVPRTRLKFGVERAFSVAAPQAWNRLPTELKLMRSTPAFKRCLKLLELGLKHSSSRLPTV